MLGLVGKYQEALEGFSKAIQLDPKHAYSYHERGKIYDEIGKSDLVLKEFDKAIESNPQFAQAYNSRGWVYARQKKYRNALVDYTKAIELNPRSNIAYYMRGLARKNIGKEDIALQDIIVSAKLGNKLAKRMLVPKKPQHSPETKSLPPKESDKDLVTKGKKLVYSRKYSEAFQVFSRAIRANPNNAEASFERGKTLVKGRNYQNAVRDLDKAIELKPDPELMWRVYDQRGLAFEKQGKFQEAINNYTKAIGIFPGNKWLFVLHIGRGQAYMKLGDHQMAIENFDKAIELRPKYGGAYYHRALVYEKLEKSQEATNDLKMAVKLRSIDARKYVESIVIKGQGLQKGNKHKEAISCFSTAIEINPNDASAYYYRGLSHHTMGSYDPAISDYTKTIELKPKFAKAYVFRGLAYKKLGNQQKSRIDLVTANRLLEKEKTKRDKK